MNTFDLKPAEERDWMGWPQVGWVRPSIRNTYTNGELLSEQLGERVYWRQEDAWTDPVAITAEEHDAFVARVRVSQPNTPPA